ncbi:ATP-binding cassette domain-containing protein [Candidatus Woesearchaeota archaeon]|nr:ATP-binding cassette domain-containing protein [Candidatus Woesearchaeota archaeon]
MYAIVVKNITKKFNALVAVDNLSFSIKYGEIFGLLGPNGAGKTTTISMMATMLEPTSGTALVNGFDIIHDPANVRRSIGIVFQDQSLDEELTAYENMDFHGRLYRVPNRVREKKIHELLQLVELSERKESLVKTFSGGMRRRLEIARGLLHEPKVLFLDEPTLGLDPQTRNHLWEYIKRLNQEKNITIILTTHYMEEADKLCHTVAIIDKGEIKALDSPIALKNTIGGDVITLETPHADQMQSLVGSFSWVHEVKVHNGSVSITLESAEKHIAEIVNIANSNNLLIQTIAIHKPTLEDVFLHFTGKTIREEEATVKDHMRLTKKIWGR